ncbi:MAG: hypothetical protein H6739_22130 [Alphaproteobacteria bacterium]|nr:hypothetical protein [Alphaproteobacteria bacterium]
MKLVLFGIPVSIERSAWMTVLLLVLGSAGSGVLAGLEAAVLGGVVLFSALVHELGHAWVARGMGLPGVAITLNALGGITQHANPASPARHIAIASAGPAFGIALGLAAFIVGALGRDAVGAVPLGRQTLWYLVQVNLLWSLLNLLPLGPLDGRVILDNARLLRRSSGSAAATRAVAAIAVCAAAALAVLLTSWWG